jgi:uncharacterized repeat protein (TIGR01451 family)
MFKLHSRNQNNLPECHRTLWRRSILTLLKIGGAVAVVLLVPSVANASITMVTDPLLVSDSNGCSTGAGPRAAYVGFKVTNNTGSTQTNLQATITGFSSGFSLTQNGSQPQTQYIGTLANNASRTVYWHFQYPCHTNKNTAPPAPSNTFTVTVNNANTSALIDSATGTVTSNSSIRANAGGLISSATLGDGAVLGQIITYDVKYIFGNIKSGDRFNLQPAGNINFRSDCLQLLTSKVTNSDIGAIPINTLDQLFYQSTVDQNGTGYTATIRYSFLYQCNGVSSSASPYSSQTSGNDLKYSGNFGAAATTITFPAATNSFSITKTATPNSLTDGGTVTYTITIKNNSTTFDARIDRITDVLPNGVTFGSTITGITGTVSAPSNGDTGTIKWLSQSPNFFEIQAGQSVQLVYTATIPDIDGTYTNSAKTGFGLGETSPATTNVIVAPPVYFDYGDAPDTYGTNSTNNNGEGVGANHVIVNTLKLGTNAPDSETDAQTPLDGTGDDKNGDDEDGISTLPSLNTSTASYSLTATVNNTTGSAANVYGWLDFDHDGKFDGDERATVSNGSGIGSITLDSNGKVPTNSNGTVTLTWNNIGSTGANIIDGNSYARIRLTTDNLSNATATTTRDPASVGNASNGEVEDYPIAIAPATSSITGTVFEDINYGGGAGRNFSTAETSATNSGLPIIGGTNRTGADNARVELYSYDGVNTNTSKFIQATTTDTDGKYSFNASNGNYLIRVVNSTVKSNRSTNLVSITPVAVQTFRRDSDATNPEIINEVGGAYPAVADSANVTTVNNPLPNNAQSVTTINVSASSINNVDFGFNFDTIVNTNDSGQGSLRQFIFNSNEFANTNLAQNLPAAITPPLDKNGNPVTLTNYETSIFMIPNPNNDNRITTGIGTGQINLSSTPPDGGTSAFVINTSAGGSLDILDEFTSVDGRTQSINIPSVSNTSNLTIGNNETTGAEVIIIAQNSNNIIRGQSNNMIFHSLGVISKNDAHAIGLLMSSNGSTFAQSTATSNVIIDSLTVSITNNCGIEGVKMVDSVIRNSVLRDSGTEQFCDNIQFRRNSDRNLIENNLILRAFHYGIDIVVTGNNNNVIRGNQIIGNGILNNDSQNGGIGVRSGTATVIENNVIRNNIGDGITVTNVNTTSTSNKITRNSIYNNGDLGIDLGSGNAGDGVTPNDTGDSDGGINQLQNFPEITNINSDGTNYTIQGSLNSTANSNFDLEIYSNNVCNPDRDGTAQTTKYGEGEKYHRTVTVTTNASGQATYSTTVAIADLAGNVITATATSQTSNDTSEFSQCFTTAPKLLLVKRITAINPGQADEVRFNTFVNDENNTDDNEANWPADKDTYLPGQIKVTGVKPGDEVEYTIYFLSNGSAQAKNVKICDVVPDNMTFVSHSYEQNFGMALAFNGTALPTTPNKNLSNAIGDGDDQGDFYPPNINPNPFLTSLCKKTDPNNPNNLIPFNSSNNLSGAVLIQLNTPIPNATGSGTPPDSYGFVRFRAKVK